MGELNGPQGEVDIALLLFYGAAARGGHARPCEVEEADRVFGQHQGVNVTGGKVCTHDRYALATQGVRYPLSGKGERMHMVSIAGKVCRHMAAHKARRAGDDDVFGHQHPST